MPKHLAYIGIGANLGNAFETISQTIAELNQNAAIKNMRVSNIYDTSPVDSSGPNYVNAVAKVNTDLAAIDLLHLLQTIELQHGRTRPYKNAPRTLDLDLLLFDDQIINSSELTVPHPRMHERAFVLQPLLDLEPNLQLTQGNLKDLLAKCTSQNITLIGPWNHKK